MSTHASMLESCAFMSVYKNGLRNDPHVSEWNDTDPTPSVLDWYAHLPQYPEQF